jgi:hypothetical protein
LWSRADNPIRARSALGAAPARVCSIPGLDAGGAQEKERLRAQKQAETEGWTERKHVTTERKTHAALAETNELEKGPCPAGVENLGQVVSLGGRLIVVLYEAAVDLDVEQRLALLCRLVLILARGLAVACHQVTHLHSGYVGVVFSVAIMTQRSTRGGGKGLRAED